MSRTGVKRAINSSTSRKTRSSASQPQQQLHASSSKATSSSAPAASASLVKRRQDSGSSKARSWKGPRRAVGTAKGKDEEQRARVDGEMQKLAGQEGKGIRIAKERPQPNLTHTQRPRVDAALTQIFEGLMK